MEECVRINSSVGVFFGVLLVDDYTTSDFSLANGGASR